VLPDIDYSLDDAIAVLRQQLKSHGYLIQAEPMRDHKFRLDPACADQFYHWIDTFILASDVYKGKSLAPGIVYWEGTPILLRNTDNDKPAHGLAQFHRLIQCRLLAAALEDNVQFQGFMLNDIVDYVCPVRISSPCSALTPRCFESIVQAVGHIESGGAGHLSGKKHT
jgi:hypothetical protein